MNLNNKIVSLLKRKKLKLAIAESCTGGMFSSAITSVSGASKVFTIGLITYSDQAKISILKIPKKIIQQHGSVSVQCCLSMVNNLNKISKSNVCVSITGIAGPKGGTKQKPVGLVYIAVKYGKKLIVRKNLFLNKGRLSIQKATVKRAQNLILKQI
tara:strand:- start:11552 stop:12019 length:468 start_codon:yes stop_codon:yes gene_type:complete